MQIDDRRVGPDLLGVTQKRDHEWLARWLAEPDKMLEEKDPIAMELYAKYKNVAMPNMQLNKVEVSAIIDYMDAESRRISPESCCTLESEQEDVSWTSSMILSSVLGVALLLLTAVFRRRT